MFFDREYIEKKIEITSQLFGYYTILFIEYLGIFGLFLVDINHTLFTKKLKFEKIIEQIKRIGVESLGIIILTGSFAGMVFALQSYIGFQRVGGEQYIGAVVALGMIRELGPVLTALMTIGRAGSAITAEIGSMQITEQIDALKTLRINIFQYLVIPRIVASVISLPLLALFSMICGILGGYFICVNILSLNPQDYTTSITTYVELSDITGGMVKSAAFGLILGLVCTYKGIFTSGGARGVGIATTKAVVLSSISTLAANYMITKILENL